MFVNRWQVAIIVYIILVGLIIIVKPAMMFTADGRVKYWSSQNTEESSAFSQMIVFPILAVLCYYLGVWLEVLSTN